MWQIQRYTNKQMGSFISPLIKIICFYEKITAKIIVVFYWTVLWEGIKSCFLLDRLVVVD